MTVRRNPVVVHDVLLLSRSVELPAGCFSASCRQSGTRVDCQAIIRHWSPLFA
jgi:hypothetical protein